MLAAPTPPSHPTKPMMIGGFVAAFAPEPVGCDPAPAALDAAPPAPVADFEPVPMDDPAPPSAPVADSPLLAVWSAIAD
jgi:hypothetical protein